MTAANIESVTSPRRIAILALCSIALLVQLGTAAEVFAQTAESELESDLSSLSPVEEQVIRFLVDDWNRDLSSTSIDLAMDALGLDPANVGLRYRIGSFIKTHPQLHVAVRSWGWETIVLTPDEKLLARAIVNATRKVEEIPSLVRLAGQVGVSEEQARIGLQILARYGILRPEPSAGGVGYVVASDRYLNWEPRVDFQFHSVYLSSGRQFNTN